MGNLVEEYVKQESQGVQQTEASTGKFYRLIETGKLDTSRGSYTSSSTQRIPKRNLFHIYRYQYGSNRLTKLYAESYSSAS